jgi:hypothetical protein
MAHGCRRPSGRLDGVYLPYCNEVFEVHSASTAGIAPTLRPIRDSDLGPSAILANTYFSEVMESEVQ